MSRAAASPGGALLRSSRLFSIPKPLPEAQSAQVSLGTNHSPTATQATPTYQAITTPRSSREKGDWGFKRPFPLKSTMTSSTPLIRVKQIDSMENVTDFASAADLTLTLEKFRELRLAPTVPSVFADQHSLANKEGVSEETVSRSINTSVFESDMDVTDPKANTPATKRWKFDGPWLARMDEGSFIKFVDKQVRPRRAEFRKLMKEKMVEERNAARSAKAREEGQEHWEQITAENITDDQFTEYVRLIRHDRAALYAMIERFLDFAPLAVPVGIKEFVSTDGEPKTTKESSPYGTSGPPPTHPSAGIGYLRTNAIVENHPVYGPQASRSPVVARILSPRNGPSSAKLGVAGFVTDIPTDSSSFAYNSRRHANRNHKGPLDGIQNLEIRKMGGAKAFVVPKKATIDPSGRVILKVAEPSREALLNALEKRRPKSQVYDDAVQKPTTLLQDASEVRARRSMRAEKQEYLAEKNAASARLSKVADDQTTLEQQIDQFAQETGATLKVQDEAAAQEGVAQEGEGKKEGEKKNYFGIDM